MKKILITLCATFNILTFVSTPVSAISKEDLHSVLLETAFYDPSSGECGVSTDVNLSGNDNFEKAYNFFRGKGMKPVATAGIVGNLIWESGGALNPKQLESSGESDSPQPNRGWGIAQWTDPTRQQNLLKYAQSIGKSASTLEAQLGFVWEEMKTYEGGNFADNLNKDTDFKIATEHFMNVFERPDARLANLEKRVEYALGLDKKYGDGAGGAESTTTDTGDCSGITSPGENTKFIDGFTVYSQYDPAWRNKPYSTSTIGESGCGPSAMAMIITALTDSRVTPVQTANYAASKGLYIPGQGSKWSIGPVLAQNWNLKAELIGNSVQKISASLQAGKLVITSGQGPKPFTSGGHFIVIRGVTESGKWKVGDSGHNDTSDKEWDPQQLVSSMNSGATYAISK